MLDPNLEPRRIVRREEIVTDPRQPVVPAPVVPAVEQEERIESGGGIESRERVIQDGAGVVQSERYVRDAATEQWLWLDRLANLVWLLIGIVEILIGLRVLLKLVAANPDAGFVSLIYNAAGVFLAPFFGIAGTPAAGGSVLEIPSLIAMVVYGIIGWLVVQLIWLFERPHTRGASIYRRFRY